MGDGLEGQDTGELEPEAQALLQILRHFCLQERKSKNDFSDFAGYLKLNLVRFILKFPQLESLGQRTDAQLATYLRLLAERGYCQLEYSGPDIQAVHYPRFYRELIRRAYEALESRPREPFPNEKQLGVEIPADLVLEINIKADFLNVLNQPFEGIPEILRLTFPEGIRDLLVTTDMVKKRLLELALAKTREFLNMRNNAGYVTHRLLPALRGNEHVLRDTINSIATKSSRALSSLLEPSDFSFRFWAHFANLIIQEYRERTDRTLEEHAFCQAAYLLGFYNVYYRGLSQKESEKSALARRFENQFRKAPFVYSLKDLYGLRDDKGVPLIRTETRDVFVQFLQNKTRAEEGKGLPEIVRLRTADEQEYYLHRDLIIPFFLKRLHERRDKIRQTYIASWSEAIKEGRRFPAMYDDEKFLRDLELMLKSQDPLLHALLNFSLLFLAREQAKVSDEMSQELRRLLDEKQGRLEPLNRILDLQRKQLLEDAKLRVPVWQRFVLLKIIANWLRDLFHGLRRERESSRQRRQAAREARTAAPAAGRQAAKEETTVASPVSPRQLAAYRKAVQDLKTQFVGRDKTLPERLAELADKWNPLYDPKARTDLVEDVNAMIRDYIRSLRRGFRAKPPDAERIRALAEQLSQNKAFERIKRKDLFLRYIEVYMIKILGEG